MWVAKFNFLIRIAFGVVEQKIHMFAYLTWRKA